MPNGLHTPLPRPLGPTPDIMTPGLQPPALPPAGPAQEDVTKEERWTPQNIIGIVSDLGVKASQNPEQFYLVLDAALAALANYRQAGLLPEEGGDSEFRRWALGQGLSDMDLDLLTPSSVTSLLNEFRGVAPAGGVAPTLSPGQDRMLIDLKNAIAVGSMSEEQAWKQIESHWSGESIQARRSEEAGRRAETLLAGAFQGEFLPGTGPGGIGDLLAKKWGLPNLMPGIRGIPMEQAMKIYGQSQEQMGLPAQLSPLQPPQFPLPNWQNLGQSLPRMSGGPNYFDLLMQNAQATGPQLGGGNSYIDQLLQEGRATSAAPTLG